MKIDISLSGISFLLLIRNTKDSGKAAVKGKVTDIFNADME